MNLKRYKKILAVVIRKVTSKKENMKEELKTLLEAKYQKAFSWYNQKEKEFFNAFNSGNGDWVLAQREMVEAWRKVDEVIQEIIALKNKVGRVKKKSVKT